MKTTRIYALLALLMFGGVMQAQEQLEVELIGDTHGYLALLSLTEDECLVTMRGEESGTMALCRMKTDGAELEYAAQMHLNQGGYIMASQQLLFLKEDGHPGIIYHKERADSLWIAVGDIGEGLMVTETGAVLLSSTGTSIQFNYKDPQYIIESDSVFAVSYFTNNQLGQTTFDQHRIIRFDKRGNVLADRIFTSVLFDPERLFAFNADSTGYLVGGCDYSNQSIVSTPCYNLDFNLDTIRLHDEIYLDFPVPGWRGSIVFPYIAKHPITGCLYVVGSSGWDSNGNSVIQDAIIAKFDKNMSHIDKWVMTIDTPWDDQRALWKSIDFFSDGSIIMCAMIQYGLYVARFDEDLNIISEVYCPSTGLLQGPFDICAMSNGSCIVTTMDDKIYYIHADSFWDVEEAHVNGLELAIAYPNPGGNTLNIRTGLRDAWVEVYDMSGRLMHRQDITENVTGIDAGGWVSGTYIWKVYTGGSSTLRPNSATASSGTLAETGKWIKK